MKRIIFWLFVAVMVWGVGLQSKVWGGAVYWVSGGRIWRAGLDGSDAKELAPSFANNLALDVPGQNMYITADLPLGAPGPTGRIWRTDLNGGGVETLLSLYAPPTSIALQPARGNLAAGKMYWTDGQSIQRSDLDGQRQETVVDKLVSPGGVSLDLQVGKVYWTRSQGDINLPAVQRANLDGTMVEDLVAGLGGPTTGLALDLAAGKMYWAYVDPNIDGLFAGQIRRSNLDGTDIETVVGGLYAPAGIALDPIGKMIYFADAAPVPRDAGGTLYRADLDGKELQVLARGLVFPGGVAVDPTVPEPGILAGLGVVAAMMLGRRRH